MGIIRYIGNWLREARREAERVNQEDLEAYRRCFEGTPEQVERRLEAWDWAHRTTRPSYQL